MMMMIRTTMMTMREIEKYFFIEKFFLFPSLLVEGRV